VRRYRSSAPTHPARPSGSSLPGPSLERPGASPDAGHTIGSTSSAAPQPPIASRRAFPSVLIGLLTVLLAITYLAPRIVGLDRLVTVDERFWLGRSANFYAALMNGELEHTYQFAHPGVMTMWAGAIGYRVAFPDYPAAHPGQVRDVADIHEVLRALDHDPLDVLIAGRTVKLLMQTVFLVIGFWLMRPVFGTVTAVVGTLLLSFDPFLVAHDRLLHVDGLFAITAFVSILALLRYLHDQNDLRFLGVSGIFAAFAWLTRTPGVVVAAVVGLVFVALIWTHQRRRGDSPVRTAMQFARPAARWGAAALGTTVLVWPALWVSPIDVYRSVLAWTFEAAAEGHETATFFYGTNYRGDADAFYALYYPLSLLWRLTPFTLVGLTAVLLGLAFRSRSVFPQRHWAPVGILAGYALLYMVGMSLGDKKFDRYLLPVYPALDLIAAVGIVGAARLVAVQRARASRVLAGAIIGGVVVGQTLSALATAPYYLTYFNPLMGGPAGASEALLLGWGEGLDQVAEFILRQPGGENAVVHMSNARTTLLYLMPESATVVGRAYGQDMESVVAWAEADYYVAYVSQWQRGSYSRPIDDLSHFAPVHTVSFEGTDFARTYDVRTIPPPNRMVNTHPCAFVFGDAVQLAAYDDEVLDLPGGINRRVFTVYFVSRSPSHDRYRVRIDLAPPTARGLEPITRSATLRPAAAAGMLSAVDVQIHLPDERTGDRYDLTVTVLDPATNRPLVARQVISGVESQRAVLPRCD